MSFYFILYLFCGFELTRANDPFMVFFSTFDAEHLAKIHRHQWKEHVKIRKFATFEGNILETGRDMDPQSRVGNFTDVCMVGGANDDTRPGALTRKNSAVWPVPYTYRAISPEQRQPWTAVSALLDSSPWHSQVPGGGILPITDYTGRLRPKGVPFLGWRYVKG